MKRMPPSVPITEADRQAWRLLHEEIETVGAVYSSGCAPSPAASRHPLPEGEGGPPLQFAQFRKIASEIAGLRTVDRNVDTPPGLPTVRLIHPHSLGSREYNWIFAPGFTDGEFPTRSPSNPLLSDRVVEAINKRIRPRRLMTARDRNRRVPLYFFMILDSATRRVTLTYPGSTLEGDPMYPSVYIGEIVRHYAESPIVRDTAATPRS